MHTRCPSCQASFRASMEQLGVRAGWVRCGKCKTPFNAFENLLDEQGQPMTLPEISDTDTVPPAAPQAPRTAPAASAVPTSTPRPSPAPATTPPVFVLEEKPEPPPPPPQDPDEPYIGTVSANGATSGNPVHGGTGLEPAIRSEPQLPVHNDFAALPTSSDTGTPMTASESPMNWRFTAIPPAEKPARSWPWWLAAFPLALLLALQNIYLFREAITRWQPETRPLLEAACKTLGCNVPLPRDPGLLGIEGSDLHPQPGRPDSFELSATLRNRAAFPQELPHLEITLTDTQDRALVRRTLEPAQWLPEDARQLSEFKANTLILVRIPFSTPEVTAAGYRIYAFYP